MNEKKKPSVVVSQNFEVDFRLADNDIVQSPDPSPSTILDRVEKLSSPEHWRLRFAIEDAESVAETFEAVASRIRQLIKDNQ